MMGVRGEAIVRLPIFISLLLLACAPAMAGEQGRLYDATGRLAGFYRQTPEGVTRVYGSNNEYLGSVFPSRDGASRIYEDRGQHKGPLFPTPRNWVQPPPNSR
jgi:hypothetical protein